jgi:hypothetical protein
MVTSSAPRRATSTEQRKVIVESKAAKGLSALLDLLGSQVSYKVSSQSLRGFSRLYFLNGFTHLKNNKKFWEELLACIPWYNTNRTENDVSNKSSVFACVFVTAVTFLPSRCLATIGGYSYGHTDWWEVFLIRPFRWAQVPWYTHQVS